MTNSNIFIISLILFSFNIKKEPSNAIISVQYEQISSIDGKVYSEQSKLVFNKEVSIFQNLPKENDITVFDNNNDSSIYVSDTKNNNYKVLNYVDKSLTSYTQIDKKNFKVIESIPQMNWVLYETVEDTKTISGFLCKKATLNFRGREYIAWYTKQLPFSFGPWKFCGLPGLILEIYDTNQMYHWTATKIDTLEKETLNFDVIENSNTTEVTLKEYVAKLDEYKKLKLDLMLKSLPREIVLEKSTSTRLSIELKYEWEN